MSPPKKKKPRKSRRQNRKDWAKLYTRGSVPKETASQEKSNLRTTNTNGTRHLVLEGKKTKQLAQGEGGL